MSVSTLCTPLFRGEFAISTIAQNGNIHDTLLFFIPPTNTVHEKSLSLILFFLSPLWG
jgi:hypothetical protein